MENHVCILINTYVKCFAYTHKKNKLSLINLNLFALPYKIYVNILKEKKCRDKRIA